MSFEYKKILVAIDGSKGGEKALDEAIEIAKQSEAHLDILQVIDLNSLEYGGAGISLDGEQIYEIEHQNEDYLLDLRKDLIEHDDFKEDQVRVHLRFGNPKLVIVEDFQPEYQNDLIIVGATGKNFIQRMMVGSVASYVTRAAKCDVLIAKTPAKK